MSENNGDFLVGLFIGALVGVTLGVLFAPKSGKKIRDDIVRNADELLVKAKDGYKKATEKCTDTISGAESFKDYWEGNNEKTV
jgi:gas vesicle protein